MTRHQLLGLALMVATFIGWPLVPGWEPFNIVDMASMPLCVGSVMLLFHVGRRRT